MLGLEDEADVRNSKSRAFALPAQAPYAGGKIPELVLATISGAE